MSKSPKFKRPRNAYINEAAHKLLKEAAMVAGDSVAVLGEFEKFEERAFVEKRDQRIKEERST